MSKSSVSPYVLIASLATLLAGVLHLTYVAAIHKDVVLEMLFFIAIGLAQILWAIWFYRAKDMRRAYLAGLVVNGSVLVVWLLSRLYEAPFGGEVEAFGTLDTVLAVLQAISLVLSAYCVVVLSKVNERRKYIVLAFLVPLISGILLFAGGRATAVLFNIETDDHSSESGIIVDPDHVDGDSHPLPAETQPTTDHNDGDIH